MKSRLIASTTIFLSSLIFYCPELLAECSLNIQSVINSGWNKEKVIYSVEKNTLKIKASEGVVDDADSIYIGSTQGCRTLTIHVSQISGQYPWGGKVIGFSFFGEKLEPHQWGNQASFPAPKGYAIEDGFVKAELLNSTTLVYEIANSAETTHIGAKIFIGSNNSLELQFSAQAASPELQASAKRSSRSSERYVAYTDHPPGSPANSCSLTCHEPPTEDGEIVFTSDFSISSHAACPDGHD